MFVIGLVMVMFGFALSGSPGLKEFKSITGNVVKIEPSDGCVKNLFSGDKILDVMDEKISDKIVVIKGVGDYYVLDAFGMVNGEKYTFVKGDLVCFDMNDLPKYVMI